MNLSEPHDTLTPELLRILAAAVARALSARQEDFVLVDDSTGGEQ